MKRRLLAFAAGVAVLGLALPPAAASGTAEVVKDGSFEGTSVSGNNADWDQSGAFPPICNAECGESGGTAGPRTGAWWAWFGGVPTPDIQSVWQDVTIPQGTATLSFWVWLGRSNGGPVDSLRVFIGNDRVFELLENASGYGTYTQVTIDVSRYSGGGAKELAFEYQGLGGVPTTNISLDDISLQAGSAGEPAATTVGLRGPKRVAEGKKATLQATLQPCPGSEGQVVELFRGKKRVASKAANASCVATFKVRISKASRFRAVASGASSNKVKVRPRG